MKRNYFALALGVSLILWAMIGAVVLTLAGEAIKPGGVALLRLLIGFVLVLAGAALRSFAASQIDARSIATDVTVATAVAFVGAIVCGWSLAEIVKIQH